MDEKKKKVDARWTKRKQKMIQYEGIKKKNLMPDGRNEKKN